MELNVGGTRRLHEGALRAREFVVEKERGVGRKELMAAARECAEGLRLRTSVRIVLCELAACYGEQPLDRGLMVWPSNDHLSRRTGLVERTIRKCVAELVGLAVLEPCDSANRKRFAIRARNGDIIDAFGFNLAPLFARRQEWTALLMQQRVEREARGRAFDEITMSRKAAEEALHAAASLGGETEALWGELSRLSDRTPRRSSAEPIGTLVQDWASLRKRVESLFYELSFPRVDSGRAGPTFRHIKAYNEPSTESCNSASQNEEAAKPSPAVTMPLLVKACPAIKDYDRNLSSTVDVIQLGRFLRASIGAHQDAWTEAEGSIGALGAASLVLYVLQLVSDDSGTGHGRIRNPGGLYRDLVRRTMAGSFNLVDELRRMKRKRMQ